MLSYFRRREFGLFFILLTIIIGVSTVSVKAEPEPITLSMEDGEYSIEVNMTGGSGKASIASPTILHVREGKAYALLTWSSPHYDYLILDDITYYNQTKNGGNSTFEIPITHLDKPIHIIADTTAMGHPVEIDYMLTFFKTTIADKGLIPEEAMKRVLSIALAIIIAGGILNYILKKRQGVT